MAKIGNKKSAKNTDVLYYKTRIDDIETLPKEVLEQLNCYKHNTLREKVVVVLKNLENVANIDEILVHLYRKFNIIITRKAIQAVLCSLSKDGILIRLKKPRGVYKFKK